MKRGKSSRRLVPGSRGDAPESLEMIGAFTACAQKHLAEPSAFPHLRYGAYRHTERVLILYAS